MTTQSALIISVILVGLVAALSVAHAAHAPRGGDPAAAIETIRRKIHRYGLLLGLLEAGAFLALLGLMLILPRDSSASWLVVVAAGCLAATVIIGAGWMRPLRASVAGPPVDAAAVEWTHAHQRWIVLHRLKIILAVIALTLLLSGLFASPAN
jgi:hypothetical protein